MYDSNTCIITESLKILSFHRVTFVFYFNIFQNYRSDNVLEHFVKLRKSEVALCFK